MRRSGLWALLVWSAASCQSSPDVPFAVPAGLHGFALGGGRTASTNIIDEPVVLGFELAGLERGTGGWGPEGGLRYAEADGDGTKSVRIPGTSPVQTEVADVARDERYWELSLGVRQTFRENRALQPYFGLGGSLTLREGKDDYDPPTVTDFTNHYSHWGGGMYAHCGVLWNLLRGAFGEDTEVPLGFDLRGMLGSDFSYFELTLVLGFGK